ncbi:MAG: hypothetical protein ABIH40_06095 [Candidatus Omnitrophota bacterium]
MKVSNGFKIKSAIKHWFTTHPWLKLIALFLAILLWLYIGEELHRYLS